MVTIAAVMAEQRTEPDFTVLNDLTTFDPVRLLNPTVRLRTEQILCPRNDGAGPTYQTRLVGNGRYLRSAQLAAYSEAQRDRASRAAQNALRTAL